MFKTKFFDDINKMLPANLGEDIGKMRADIAKAGKVAASSAMQKLDLVSREEYDIQVALLARTRAKVDELEAKLAELSKDLAE